MLSLARILVILGLILLLVGGALYLVARVGIPLGRLPGDIRIERENFTCVFPLVTSLVLSLLLTLILNLIARFLGSK